MNAIDMARTAYAASATPVRTPRRTEYEAFARVTHRLTSAYKLGRKGRAALIRALHENRQLWTLLAADIAGEENDLPDALRAQIFSLAHFTNRHTSDVLAKRADARVLIEVNAAIMRGLRGEGADR